LDQKEIDFIKELYKNVLDEKPEAKEIICRCYSFLNDDLNIGLSNMMYCVLSGEELRICTSFSDLL
jgi:hypothetical protein